MPNETDGRQTIGRLWKKIGPGVITGASDDDPSGIATYSQAGAMFGLQLLWTALLTYPLMFAIQEMSARIGITHSSGLIGVIRKHYHPVLAWAVVFLIVPAIVFNIAADLAGMAAILHYLVPAWSSFAFSFLIAALSLGYMFFFRFQAIVNIFRLLCLALLGYFIVPFLVEQDWGAVLVATVLPQFEWSKEFAMLVVAVLGTTISPYLFFWQSSLSHEHRQQAHKKAKAEIRWMEWDVNVGMLASNLAMYFIILTTGSVLYVNGKTDIRTVEAAAEALRPLAGDFAFALFAVGVLGLGFLAIPVLCGCIGYMVAECLGWKGSLNETPVEAPRFYLMVALSVILALGINYVGMDPVRALIFTAVMYGVITPPVIAFILHICNSTRVMGKYTNSLIINVLGVAVFLVMSAAAFVMIYLELQ